MTLSTAINGGGSGGGASARSAKVTNGATGVVATISTGLKAPLTVARDSGSTSITFAASGNKLTAAIATALAVGSSLSAIARVTQVDGAGVLIPVTLTGVAAAPAPTPSPTPTPSGVMRVVVLAGQSNIIGRTAYTTRDAADLSLANLKQYPAIASDSATYRQIRDSVFPLYFPENLTASNYFSPGNRIGAEIAAAYPGDKVVLLPVGWGSTTLVSSSNGSGTTGAPQWAEPSGNLNVAAVAHVNAFMAANPTAVLHSIHWIKGENDAGGASPVNQTAYHDALQALINGWRTRITGNSASVPFVIGSITPGFIAANAAAPGVVAAQKALATELTNVKYVDAAAGFDDALHYDHTGAASIGVAMARVALGSAPGVMFNETFTGTDSAALTTLDWKNATGTGSTLFSGMALLASNTVSNAPVQVFDTADYAVVGKINFSAQTTHFESIRARAIGSSSMTGYQLRANFSTANGGTITWSILRYDGSSATGTGIAGGALGTWVEAGVGTAGTRDYAFDLRGSTIRAIINSVERINVTDNTYTTQRGAQGIVGTGDTTSAYVGHDNYSVTTAPIA